MHCPKHAWPARMSRRRSTAEASTRTTLARAAWAIATSLPQSRMVSPSIIVIRCGCIVAMLTHRAWTLTARDHVQCLLYWRRRHADQGSLRRRGSVPNGASFLSVFLLIWSDTSPAAGDVGIFAVKFYINGKWVSAVLVHRNLMSFWHRYLRMQDPRGFDVAFS